MNIYFACSITGGREFESIYRAITEALLSDGHEVPTAHLADSKVKVFEGQVASREVYERDTAWIRTCKALVAEVSTPSHGVGYEVAYALSLGKPVLCVYREGQPVSKMLTGNSNTTITVKSYRNSEEAIGVIRSFLKDQIEL
jgi:2'-deoxynucleoside 5'-phosphate N-hydrolase